MIRASALVVLIVVPAVLTVGCGFTPPSAKPTQPVPTAAAVPTPKTDPPAAEPRALSPTESVTIDGLYVRVVSARIGRARYAPMDGQSLVTDNEDSLIVTLELKAMSPVRKIEYLGWRDMKYTESPTDEHGNRYPSRLSRHSMPEGGVSFISLRPGDTATDVLVFDRPIPAATQINLDLPGVGAAGVKGTFRFHVPRSMWESK